MPREAYWVPQPDFRQGILPYLERLEALSTTADTILQQICTIASILFAHLPFTLPKNQKNK